jgi:CDGSH-type Zn-finger protein
MLKLWDFECACGATCEALVEGEEMVRCRCGKPMQRIPFTQGTAARAEVNPARTREMFQKAQEMRNKATGKTPWRRSSYSQTGND